MQAKWPSLLLLMVALGFSLCAAPALAEDVGQFTRVVNEVEQLKKGKGPPKLAKVPDGVENQDIVQTKEKAMAVVQFADDSTITISPKSKVTIENYMYDAEKGRSKGAIKVLEGVVEAVIPTTDKLQKKDINIFTTTAIAGIRGTKVITVVKPEGTVFYVVPDEKQAKPEKSKIRIRLFSPECQPGAPAMRFVSERLKKKMPLKEILEDALAAGLDPCDVIKAAIINGVNVEQLAANFQNVCANDPELKQICTPCIILKCTVEAMRCLKEADLSEGEYGILKEKLAPILGDIKPEDMAAIETLPTTGIVGAIPNYPPTEMQLYLAKLPQASQGVASSLIAAGADATAVNNCLKGLGVTEPPTPPSTTSTVPAPSPSGVGGGGQPPEEIPPEVTPSAAQ